jgi:hypothetical protein
MSHRRCCCSMNFCTIHEGLSLSGWTTQSGTWTQSESRVVTSSANAVLACNATLGDFTNHVVTAQFFLAAYNSRPRVIFNYHDSSNFNYVEFHRDNYNTYMTVVSVSGGTETTVYSGQIYYASSYSNTIELTVKLCITASSVTVNIGNTSYIDNFNHFMPPLSITSTAVAAAIGTGNAAYEVDFYQFYLLRKTSGDTRCESCSVCSNCSAGTSSENYQATFSGLSNDHGCAVLNNSFILTEVNACHWCYADYYTWNGGTYLYTIHLHIDGSTISVGLYVCSQTPNGGLCVELDENICSISSTRSCLNDGGGVGWSVTLNGSPIDCNFSSLSIPLESSEVICGNVVDGSNATCVVSAV